MTTSLLVFDLGQSRYAIHFSAVKAVLESSEPCRLPETPEFILGIVASPVGPVPLVDLRRKFRLDESAVRGSAVAVVVECVVEGVSTLLAIQVGDSCEIVDVPPDAIQPPPPLGSGLRAEFLRGVVQVADMQVAIIDLGLALTASEKEAIEGLERDPSSLVVDGTRGPDPSVTSDLETLSDEEYLVFSVSGETMALPLRGLRAVAQHRPPTSVPGAASWIRGAINLRGEVIPLLDLSAALHLPPSVPTSHSYSLILDVALRSGSASVALSADDVLDVVSGTCQQVMVEGLRLPPQYVRGVIRSADAFVPQLDSVALLAGLRTMA